MVKNIKEEYASLKALNPNYVSESTYRRRRGGDLRYYQTEYNRMFAELYPIPPAPAAPPMRHKYRTVREIVEERKKGGEHVILNVVLRRQRKRDADTDFAPEIKVYTRVVRRGFIEETIRKLMKAYTELPDQHYYHYNPLYFYGLGEGLPAESYSIMRLEEQDDILLGRAYGEIEIRYMNDERFTNEYSCTIDTLINCGFRNGLLMEAFGESWMEVGRRFPIKKIIEFVETNGGSLHLFDLYDSRIYSSADDKKNRTLKSFIAILANGHVHEVIDERLRKKLLAKCQAKKKTAYKLKRKEKPIEGEIVYKNQKDIETEFDAYLAAGGAVPKHDFTDGKLNNYTVTGEVGNIVYTTNKNTDLVERITGMKTISSLNSVAIKMFHNFMEKKEYDYISYLNPEVREIFDSANIGPKFYKFNENIAVDQIDANKMYSEIMRHMRICRIDCVSEVKAFSIGEIVPGIYRVRTDDYYLFRGDGWYTDKVLKLASEEGIKYECDYFIPLIVVGEGLLHEFIDDIYLRYGDDAKHICNRMNGCFNKKSIEVVQKKTIVSDPIDASYYLHTYGANIYQKGGKWVDYDMLEDTTSLRHEGRALYHCIVEKTNTCLTGVRPLYFETLCDSFIFMYKKMKSVGLENVCYIKTDAIGLSVEYTGEVGLEHGMFKHEELGCKAPKQGKYCEFGDIKLVENEWNEIVATYSDDDAADLEGNMEKIMDKSCLVTGSAGTGKTFLALSMYPNSLRLSFTNAAAGVIQGSTFHSHFNSKFDDISDMQMTEINKHDALIVDECSMFDRDIWTLLCIVKEKLTIPMIVCGDFRQIPPINDSTDYENSLMLKKLVGFNRMHLTKVYRYDFEYDKLIGYHEADIVAMEKPRGICYTNRTRIAKTTEIITKRYFNEMFRIGFPMVCKETDKRKALVNNALYEIVAIEGVVGEYIEEKYKDMAVTDYMPLGLDIDTSNTKIFMKKAGDAIAVEFTYAEVVANFRHAFLITAHQAQGQSFDFEYCIFDWKIMTENMKYVAVTRTRKLESLLNFN